MFLVVRICLEKKKDKNIGREGETEGLMKERRERSI